MSVKNRLVMAAATGPLLQTSVRQSASRSVTKCVRQHPAWYFAAELGMHQGLFLLCQQSATHFGGWASRGSKALSPRAGEDI